MNQDPNIQQPVAEPCEDQQAEKCHDYDMVDSRDEFQRWPKLEPVLRDLGATVVAAYCAADYTSRRKHAWHKAATIFAGLGGMFAVLFAIAQLTPILPFVVLRPDWVKHLELVAAFVALFAVVAGLWAAVSKKWLVEREKAERCRFLKFSLLISRDSWGDDLTPEERRKRFCTHLKCFTDLTWRSLRSSMAKGNEALEDTTSRVAEIIDKETLAQLLDYYQEKRLYYQLQYFERQTERRGRWDWLTRVLPLWLFFLSIGAALLHFLLDVSFFHRLLVEPLLDTFPALTAEGIEVGIQMHGETFVAVEYDTVTLFLLMLAACFPVIGAAIRLLRTAHEFGRNTLRFQATSNELEQLADGLQTIPGPYHPQAKLQILYKTERALEAERREWLRLMIDAEWFG